MTRPRAQVLGSSRRNACSTVASCLGRLFVRVELQDENSKNARGHRIDVGRFTCAGQRAGRHMDRDDRALPGSGCDAHDGRHRAGRRGFTTGDWWRLTPDAPATMSTARGATVRLEHARRLRAALLLLGGAAGWTRRHHRRRVQLPAQGGTYVANEQNKGAIYTPSTNTWANLPPPAGVNRIGDSMCTVLPTGPHAGQLALGPNSGSKMYPSIRPH